MPFRKLRRRLAHALGSLVPSRRALRRVALISYPKSGRTWIRFMLGTAGLPIEYSHSGAGNRLGLTFDEVAPRLEGWQGRRVVFLYRDPRDTVVSCYFQATRRIEETALFSGTISEFMRSERYGIDKIARFNLHWLESAAAFRDFTPVSYEALHADTRGQLGRIIRFITGKPANPETLDRAVDAGRFDNMRKVEVKLGDTYDTKTRLGGGIGDDTDRLKTRRGKVGGWTDYFDADDIAFMDAVLERLDYRRRVDAATAPAAEAHR